MGSTALLKVKIIGPVTGTPVAPSAGSLVTVWAKTAEIGASKSRAVTIAASCVEMPFLENLRFAFMSLLLDRSSF